MSVLTSLASLMMPPTPRPFENVKREISEAVFREKVKKSVETWGDRLRDYYEVKIYGTGLEK